MERKAAHQACQEPEERKVRKGVGKVEIVIKIGTHALTCVHVCRKRKKPVVGDIIMIKKNHFAKEERIRITGVPTYPANCYFGDYA